MSIEFIYTLLLIFHVMLCFFLIGLILLQSDKGGGLAGALGGMGSGAALSGKGATSFLTKITQFVAISLFVLILGLNVLSGKKNALAGGGGVSELKATSEDFSSVLPEELKVNQSTLLPGIGDFEGSKKTKK